MSTNKNTLKIYLKEMGHHKPSFTLAFILIPLSAILLDTGLAYFLSSAIGDLAGGNGERVAQNLVIAAVIGVVAIAANFIGFQALIRHEARVRSRIMRTVFSSLLNKDLQFFVNEKVGALTSRFIDFTRAHVTLQDLVIIRTIGFAISLVLGLIIVALNAPLLALVLVALLAAVICVIKFFTKLRAPLRHKRKKMVSEINGEAADSITNSLMVKTFAHEEREIATLDKKLGLFEKIYIKDIGLFGVDGTIRNTLAVTAQIIAISIAAGMVLSGNLTIAIAIFALTYLQRISMQVFSLGELINGYDEALLQAAPMSEALMKPVEVFDAPNATNHTIKNQTITLDNVTYAYSDSKKPVLKDVTLSIPAGQKVGLVGHSGAGKTTITHLLLRFADVNKGAILIDDRDVRLYTQQSLREQIAYVPQEPMLFHRTLRENISYGKLDATDAEIEDAARRANALDFIQKLPEGFDTLVGERGVKLSGGQRQRVAIARAILKDAPILVLDEATSALDSESEALIQQSLDTLMQDRTSLVIAHRLSTIAKLDRIIVMDKGTIVEDGSHKELVAKKGIYAKLWARQSGGFIEE